MNLAGPQQSYYMINPCEQKGGRQLTSEISEEQKILELDQMAKPTFC